MKIRFTAIISLMLCAGLIFSPQTAASGIKSGLNLCLNAIIPSLFPFLVLSFFVVQSGAVNSGGIILGNLVNKLFRLPKTAGGVVLMSLIGGYPTGAHITSELLKSEIITRKQAQRMILFCVNSGPAFVISTVGNAILGNRRAGMVIFVSLTLSSVFMGVMSRFINDDSLGKDGLAAAREAKSSAVFSRPLQILPQSVMSACVSMAGICAWIMLFCCFGEFLTLLRVPQKLIIFTKCLTEVTAGCFSLKGLAAPPVFAAVLGWGGAAVHCQILKYVNEIGIKPTVFLASRAVNGILAAVICDVLLKFFPCELSAFAPNSAIIPSAFSISLPTAAGVLFMCAVFILDVDTDVKI